MALRTEPDGGELSASEEGDAKEGEEEPSIYPPLAPGFMRARQADGKVRSTDTPVVPAPSSTPTLPSQHLTVGNILPSSTFTHRPAPSSTSQHRPALTSVTHLATRCATSTC
jgi:hypothetical protein